MSGNRRAGAACGPKFPAASRERRATPRFAAQDYRTWLGWWTGPSFQVAAVRLLDVSRGGAAGVVVGTPPSPGQSVWLRLHEDPTLSGVKGTVVQVQGAEDQQDGHVVRLRFAGLCPEDFYQAALRGLPS